MRKVLLLLMLLMPVVVEAKTKYTIHLVEEDTNIYEDSLVRLTIDISQNLYSLNVTIENKTDKDMVVEWENMRVGPSHIAFTEERVFEINTPKQDETVFRNGFTKRMICLRCYPLQTIVIKEVMKRIGSSTIPIDLSFKVGGKRFLVSPVYVVEKEKK